MSGEMGDIRDLTDTAASGELGPILETLRDGVAVVDARRRLKGCNTAYLRQFGLEAGALEVGESLESMLRKIADKGGLCAGLAREQAIARRLAAWGTEADRRERRYLANGRVQDIYRSETETGDIVSVHVDVTEAVRRDRELELHRLYMESILENITDGVTLVDADGYFIAFNNRFLELFRIDPARARWGMHAIELEPLAGDLENASEADRRAAYEERLRFSTTHEDAHVERHLLDGRTLDLRKSAVPGGGVAMTIRDITEDLVRKRELEEARARAEETSRHKSQFLARMSHEIRTPLNGVLGVAALLRATPLEERQRDYVDVIVGSGDTLVRLIDDILDLSRIEAGRIALRNQPFAVCQVMRESIGLIEPIARDKGLTLIKDPSPTPVPSVVGDPVRLKQVVLNLLGNAVKFTDAGSVTVGLRVHPAETTCGIEIRVADTGIGIPPEELGAVFDNFYQVSGDARAHAPGAGLGLAVTRGLVAAMGGTVEIESSTDAGTTFLVRLSLPLAGAPAPAETGV